MVFLQLPARILLAVGVGYLVRCLLPEDAAFLLVAVLAGIAGFVYSVYLHTALSRWKALRHFSRSTLICLILALVLLVLGLLGGAVLEVGIGLTACVFSALATAVGPRRSQRGQDLLSEAKGCRLFYRQVTWQRLQLLCGRNSRFFQMQLPKAAALGVDKKFAVRFERLPVPRPEWLGGKGNRTTTASALQREIDAILKGLRQAFRV